MIPIARNEVRNEESCGAINPDCSGTACCCGHSRGAAAEQSPLDRVSISERCSWCGRERGGNSIGLVEHGQIEGQNIAIEYRYSAGKPERAPELAAELVRLKVDIIVAAGGPTWVEAAKNVTKTIPIVMVGLLASLRKHPCDFCNGANRGSCPSSDHFGFKRDCPHLGGNA